MYSWPIIASMVCASGASVGCVYLSIAILAVMRFPRPQKPHHGSCVPVSVLKPLHGDEPGLSMRLASYFEQSYSGAIHMVCGVKEHADAATAHVRGIQGVREGCVDLVVDDREHGPNRKISNLANMLKAARHDVLVISDSDIEVRSNYLESVVAHLMDENIGAVTCLYHGVSGENLWSRHEALAINSHFLPNIIVALTFGLADPCCGSTIALHRDILDAIGGFERFGEHLADDYEIGRSVRSAGFDIAVPRFTVGHHCHSDTLKSLFARELRAARTIRCIDPLGYIGAVITHPFPLALASVFAFGSDAFGLAAVTLSLRALLCISVERACGLPRQPYKLLPFGELISFTAFCASFFSSRIAWRGTEFGVTRDGQLKAAHAGPEQAGLKAKC